MAPRTAKARTRHAAPRAPADRHAQGPVDDDVRRRAAGLEARGAAVPRAHRAPRRARPARRQDAARGREDRPPGADGVPLDRRRPHVEGGDDAAEVRAGQRARRRPHVLADARATRRSPASGGPARRRRGCSVPATAARRGKGVAGFNAHPQRKAWCGGDQDGTPDGPKLHSILIDPRDAAAHVHQHVERRDLRIQRRRRRLAPAEPGRARRLPAQPRHRVRARLALRALRGRQPGPALPAEPLRPLPPRPAGHALDRHRHRHAEVGRLRRLPDGPASARPGHRVDLSDGWRPTCGRGCRPAASPPRTARATAASRGSGRRTACRRRRRGGR